MPSIKILNFILAVITFSQLQAQAAEDNVSIAADPWCPYTCDAQSNDKGYLIEIAQKAFSMSGKKIDYQNASWSKVLHDVRQGNIIAAAGAGDSDKEGLIFTAKPITQSQNCFFVKKDSKWKYTGIDSLKEVKLGITQGYTFDETTDAYISNNPTRVDATTGDNALEANLKKLLAGRVDTYLDDANVIEYNKKQWPNYSDIINAGCLEPVGIYIGFSAKHANGKKLAEEFEKNYKEAKAKGELKTIEQKYNIK